MLVASLLGLISIGLVAAGCLIYVAWSESKR